MRVLQILSIIAFAIAIRKQSMCQNARLESKGA